MSSQTLTVNPASAQKPSLESMLRGKFGQRAIQYLVLSAIAIICLYPMWWTLVVSLSTTGNVYEFPPPLLPKGASIDNYAEVFKTINVMTFFKNSLAITILTLIGTIVVSSLAAYPLARMRFPGRNLVFSAILATMILPSEVNFLVNFITVSKLHLTDSYLGVALPNIVTAVNIFIMKVAFEQVPGDLIDAARVDGASEMQIFWKIMMPLALPALGAITILTTVTAWNQYIWPAIVMQSPDNFPLSVGVLYLSGAFSFKTRVVAAGAILTILPILIVFIFTQRYFLRGFDGAVK